MVSQKHLLIAHTQITLRYRLLFGSYFGTKPGEGHTVILITAYSCTGSSHTTTTHLHTHTHTRQLRCLLCLYYQRDDRKRDGPVAVAPVGHVGCGSGLPSGRQIPPGHALCYHFVSNPGHDQHIHPHGRAAQGTSQRLFHSDLQPNGQAG